MDYKLQFSSLSIIDLEKIIEYYFELNKSTAKKYYKTILLKVKKLKQFPKMGRIVPEFEDLFHDKYREIIYEHFRIIYKISGNVIIIIRIIDSRRLLEIDAVKV